MREVPEQCSYPALSMAGRKTALQQLLLASLGGNQTLARIANAPAATVCHFPCSAQCLRTLLLFMPTALPTTLPTTATATGALDRLASTATEEEAGWEVGAGVTAWRRGCLERRDGTEVVLSQTVRMMCMAETRVDQEDDW